MRYEGPIYRPPSEADSLLIQATIGCPHNRCNFCMVYKNGPKYRVRPVAEIKQDMVEAKKIYGPRVRTMFLPAGNTIAMNTQDLADVCCFARTTFPCLERITVYGSSQFIHKKGPDKLRQLAEAGLGRIHVGLESGDDVILRYICKGTNAGQQIEAGRWLMDAGIELSLYVILGIGGRERTYDHARETARVINEIAPDFVRLRTFVPKINTPILDDVLAGRFKMLTPYGILREAGVLIEGITAKTSLTSDHYTNYINLHGRLPQDKPRLLKEINHALEWKESDFRPFFIGTE
ncbi:MAG: radical SAM protein [Deltaproteobacteria bacterium]|nr:radical SAM protein [Deltaproteobacteria bacterium]MBW1947239.1 radical SAM protein [Deltaproteobacteria bacterium]MBW1966628.1 radical SAM protein [Deltaproteobacteria bacterium]MBW2098962.1 radical SAM protein [Deltaproteobacteria bacterium]